MSQMAGISTYKLRASVSEHTNDVRAVAFIGNDSVLTTSRDGTAKITTDGNTMTIIEVSTFLNSCTVSSDGSGVFIGSNDASITNVGLKTGELKYYLGHTANVSCLDHIKTNNNTAETEYHLVSGSWDTTVRVWSAPDASTELKGHSQYVWAVKFLDDEHVLSAGADKTIILWHVKSKKMLKTFNGHTDVVRALLVLSPSEFLSASNDGTIRKWNIKTSSSIATWTGHSSFLYSMARVSESTVVSSAEDRTVRIWDIESGQAIQTIILPSISQWSVASNEIGEFVVGSSDNTARIFTQVPDREASQEEQAAFEAEIKGSAIGESEIDESQVSDIGILEQPGKQEGQVVVVRNGQTKKLEAHQFSGGSWFKVGDVVGANQTTGSKKESFDGKQYDYVFDVDIADDQDPLKLPFNNSDNPYIVAETFVADNNLPPSYVDQVVKFLITNSEAKQIHTASAAGSEPAAELSSVPKSPVTSSITNADEGNPPALRYSTLVFIKSFQSEPILRALNRVADSKGENFGVYNVNPVLNSLPSSASELLKISVELYGKWQANIDDLLPVYDLLRISLADALLIPHQVVWMHLISALDVNLPKHSMLAVRGVSNLIANPTFNGRDKIQSTLLSQALSMIEAIAKATQSKFSKSMATAIATLTLNLTVLNLSTIQYAKFISSVAAKIVTSGDAEAVYRLVLAIGLRSTVGEGHMFKSAWFTNVPQEERITELLSIVKPRIN